MKRHGNDRVETAFANALVVERRNEPARDQMTEMNLFSVFEIENHVPNDPASAIGRDCGLEIKVSMRAVGTGEFGRDRAVKWFGTFRAKRRNNPRDFGFALGAKIFA